MAGRRFLILLGNEGYYARMGVSIGQGLLAAGAERVGLVRIPTTRLLHRLNPADLEKALREFVPTDTFTVNVPRRLLPIPPGVTHHRWVQDPYDTDVTGVGERERIWMWVRHWCDWWGGDFLPPATEYATFPREPADDEADVAFAGVLPLPQLEIVGRPEANLVIRRLEKAVYLQLMVARDLFCERGYAEKLLAQAERMAGQALDSSCMEVMLHHVRSRLFRYVQRKRLLDLLLPVCRRRGWRLRLAGEGWSIFPECRPYLAGHVEPGPALARFFRSARVNLHVNPDTNIHSRVLEGLGSGAFVLAAAHVTDGQPGGLRSIFPEEVVPTFADARELEEKLAYTIADGEARRKAAEAGREIVRTDHVYDVRMRELLKE